MKYHSRYIRRRRNTDQWEVRLLHKDPLTLKDITSYHTVIAKTKKQAEKARDELILQLELKGGSMYSGITIKEFIESFVDYKESAGTIEASTIKGYRYEARQISKYLGAIHLSELSIADVNRWMAQMLEEGYAPKTIISPFRLLKQALNHAMAQDLITKNPCMFCKPPKKPKTKINALSREERSRMLACARSAQPKPLAVAIELALTTGLRRGEVCGLRWSDLNEDGSITIRRAIGSSEGGCYVKEPKTPGSARTIPLTRHTFNLLNMLKRDSIWLLNKIGISYSDPYIIGTQENESRYYNPSLLTKEFTAFCKMNNFDCSFNDLRHTFATFMIGSGVDVRTVASYLGHSSVSMTLNVYADVDPEAKRGAVNKIEEAFDSDIQPFYNRRSQTNGFYMNDYCEMPGNEPSSFNQRAFESGMGNITLSSQNIPFTEEELENMLAKLRAEKQKNLVR